MQTRGTLRRACICGSQILSARDALPDRLLAHAACKPPFPLFLLSHVVYRLRCSLLLLQISSLNFAAPFLLIGFPSLSQKTGSDLTDDLPSSC